MKNVTVSRVGLYALLLMLGIAMSTWATRTPALKDMLGASTEQMGLVLLGFACGSMLGILVGGKFVKKFYVRFTMCVGAISVILGLFVLVTVLFLPKQYIAFTGLFFIGFGNGLVDIAGNIECCAIQNKMNKHLLSTLHGFFCIGTLSGSFISIIVSFFYVTYETHLIFVCIILMCMAVFGISLIKNASSEGTNKKNDKKINTFAQIKEKRIFLLCIVILGLALAEGAANDWLPLLMRDGHGFAESTGTLIYLVFTAGMATGRLSAPIFLRHFKPEFLIIFSALFAAIGVSLAIFSNNSLLGCLSVLFWGFGASLGFPLVISCASYGNKEESNSRVSLVATVGYTSFLVSPPFLGSLGGYFGIRYAMLPVLFMTLVSFVVAVIINKHANNLKNH